MERSLKLKTLENALESNLHGLRDIFLRIVPSYLNPWKNQKQNLA
jgi:hypothetical protein